MNIAIQRWCAWQPQASGGARCSSFAAGDYTVDLVEKPALENVPAMQRRRLSEFARIVFHVLDHCTEPGDQEPVIFSSVMGEIKRTQSILDAIAIDESVSPASFSLSVHNSIGGLWSLIKDNKSPMIALSPSTGSPVAAMLEAAGILAEGVHRAVTVVYYEEDYPQFYEPFLNGPVAPYALALTLTLPDDGAATQSILLDLEQLPPGTATPQWHNNLDLLGILADQEASVLIAEPRCSWRLNRRP